MWGRGTRAARHVGRSRAHWSRDGCPGGPPDGPGRAGGGEQEMESGGRLRASRKLHVTCGGPDRAQATRGCPGPVPGAKGGGGRERAHGRCQTSRKTRQGCRTRRERVIGGDGRPHRRRARVSSAQTGVLATTSAQRPGVGSSCRLPATVRRPPARASAHPACGGARPARLRTREPGGPRERA